MSALGTCRLPVWDQKQRGKGEAHLCNAIDHSLLVLDHKKHNETYDHSPSNANSKSNGQVHVYAVARLRAISSTALLLLQLDQRFKAPCVK